MIKIRKIFFFLILGILFISIFLIPETIIKEVQIYKSYSADSLKILNMYTYEFWVLIPRFHSSMEKIYPADAPEDTLWKGPVGYNLIGYSFLKLNKRILLIIVLILLILYKTVFSGIFKSIWSGEFILKMVKSRNLFTLIKLFFYTAAASMILYTILYLQIQVKDVVSKTLESSKLSMHSLNKVLEDFDQLSKNTDTELDKEKFFSKFNKFIDEKK